MIALVINTAALSSAIGFIFGMMLYSLIWEGNNDRP